MATDCGSVEMTGSVVLTVEIEVEWCISYHRYLLTDDGLERIYREDTLDWLTAE